MTKLRYVTEEALSVSTISNLFSNRHAFRPAIASGATLSCSFVSVPKQLKSDSSHTLSDPSAVFGLNMMRFAADGVCGPTSRNSYPLMRLSAKVIHIQPQVASRKH